MGGGTERDYKSEGRFNGLPFTSGDGCVDLWYGLPLDLKEAIVFWRFVLATEHRWLGLRIAQGC